MYEFCHISLGRMCCFVGCCRGCQGQLAAVGRRGLSVFDKALPGHMRFLYIKLCIYVYTYVHVYTNIYTHIYIHIYICLCRSFALFLHCFSESAGLLPTADLVEAPFGPAVLQPDSKEESAL